MSSYTFYSVISKAAVLLAPFPEHPVLCEQLEEEEEEDAHTQLGLIPQVGLCRLSQDLLPKVSEG